MERFARYKEIGPNDGPLLVHHVTDVGAPPPPPGGALFRFTHGSPTGLRQTRGRVHCQTRGRVHSGHPSRRSGSQRAPRRTGRVYHLQSRGDADPFGVQTSRASITPGFMIPRGSSAALIARMAAAFAGSP